MHESTFEDCGVPDMKGNGRHIAHIYVKIPKDLDRQSI